MKLNHFILYHWINWKVRKLVVIFYYNLFRESAKKVAKNELDNHSKLFLQRHDQRTTRFTCECKYNNILDIDAIKWKVHRSVQQVWHTCECLKE
jgi:hypothetical protein